MPYPLPLTRTEAYLAYKAGVIQQSDLKPSLAVPRNGIDAWLAYWTGLAADYPKREDGTPHILQEEEAYIAYLCGVINEYPEKCLRRVGAYLRYLISARWGRPDHPLNREELYLSLIKTQFIPSGDPSSDIEIDGTAKAPFVDVKMYGDTFQQSYTGKNLLNLPATFADSGANMTTTTSNGLTTISSSGTTRTYPHWCEQAANYPAGTYTFSISKALEYDMFIRLYQDSSTYPETFTIRAGETKSTKTIAYDVVKIMGLIAIPLGSAYSKTFNAQVESGSTATAFEPYVGGQPSPNPEYPQPIQTVTGSQVVEVRGKNLFDETATPWYSGRAYDGNGELAYWSGYVAIVAYQPVEPNTTYTFSNSAGKAIYYGLVFYDADKNKISNVSSATRTFTTPADCRYVRFAIQNNAFPIWTQLEKGSSATAYESYSSNEYEINLGKNLYNKNTAPVLDAYISAGVTTITYNNANRLFYIPCNPNTTYTFQKVSSAQFNIAYTHEKPALGVQAYGIVVAGAATTATITTDSQAKYLICRYYQTAQDTKPQATVEASIQVEIGDTATAYAPYFEPIELCKLGTYQDYIYKDGENWKVHKATGKYVYGDDLAQNGISETMVSMVTPALPVIRNLAHDSGICQSNMYTPIDQNGTGLSGTTGTNKIRIYTAISIANSYDKVRQLASENNLTIYYPLGTATDTAITDQTLIAQLEALVNGGAENGTTYIKVNATDPNLPGLLVVEAPKYE